MILQNNGLFSEKFRAILKCKTIKVYENPGYSGTGKAGIHNNAPGTMPRSRLPEEATAKDVPTPAGICGKIIKWKKYSL